ASLREFELDHGVPHNLVYDVTLYIMAGLLFCGLVCNFFVKPVDKKNWMTDEELAREQALQHEDLTAGNAAAAARGGAGAGIVLAWLAVGIPFCIGLYIALEKAAALM
ncbi:MAG: MFS transporter, partial [Xanthobacteraceae bacterium]